MEARLKIVYMVKDVDVFKKIPPKKLPVTNSVEKAKRADFDFLEYDKGSRQSINPNAFDNMDIEQGV